MSAKAPDPSQLLETLRIFVVVGTGGVGKTTVAAAVAIEAARRGRRVLALTIDPARRLCDALGLSELDSPGTSDESPGGSVRGEAQELPIDAQRELGIDQGSLHVMMLDMKSTFDGLVDRFSESEAAKRRVLANPIYQHVSDALAGSNEYAAMEKVFELTGSGDYDLIVLDTPPSQHALDFLDAPRRLLEFLDSRLVQLLFHPAMAAGRFGFRIFNRTSQRILRGLERVSGVGFLEDISEFLLAFEGMSEGFRERATRVRELLLGSTSRFLLVTGAGPQASRSALDFLARMRDTGVPLAGVCMNRIRLWPEGALPEARFFDEPPSPDELLALAGQIERAYDGELRSLDSMACARTAVALAKRYASLVQLDERSSVPLREQAEQSGQFFRHIPELPHDVSSLCELSRIGEMLFRSDPTRPSGDESYTPIDAATQP
jgi:anion-transporting  ArsA/GET3 family ATPase